MRAQKAAISAMAAAALERGELPQSRLGFKRAHELTKLSVVEVMFACQCVLGCDRQFARRG